MLSKNQTKIIFAMFEKTKQIPSWKDPLRTINMANSKVLTDKMLSKTLGAPSSKNYKYKSKSNMEANPKTDAWRER